ncbi:MAG: T9SS type A sorting domain-containing protein [Saprospiraceae bacterium]|nr:T9SS type A sorting domain-containing protein [Saprospiraceae bacterium]
MRIIYSLLMILLFNNDFSAQITVTNATFPIKGDTLKTVITSNISAPLIIGDVGGPQTWNFSMLNTGSRITQLCLDPKDGAEFASFPSATLMIQTDGQIQYINATPTKMEVLGLGGDNGFIPTQVAVKYTDKPAFRVAPLKFIGSYNSNAKFNLDLGTEIIPDTILSSLPLKPDSIRIQFVSASNNLMDAFGKLTMQNKTYDVLREKSETTTEVKFFAKLPFGWFDVGSIIGGSLPGGLGNFLGKDTTITYNFYSNVKKEILVSADYNTANEFQSVTFADLGGVVSSSNELPSIGQSYLEVFPNPATDIIAFKTDNLTTGKYFITLSDMSGRVVYFENSHITKDEVKNIKTANFAPGQYILMIRDQFNHTNVAVKVIIL